MNQALSPFARSLSALRHDLRNSVGHILGYSEMLQEDLEDHSGSAFLEDLGRINESGRRLLDLVEEHLSMTHTTVEEIDLPFIQHQLRIQLNHILGYTELVLETAEEEGKEEIVDDLNRIAQSAAILLSTLEERLTLEYLESASAGGALLGDGDDDSADGARPEEIQPGGDEASDAAPPSPAPEETVGATVLVVDDDPLNREMLERRLARQGYDVATAAGGDEAFAYLADELPDIVLLDMVMPGMTGMDVLERMKADRRLRAVPVIMLSGSDDMERIVRCILMGAEDYLMKPFNPVLLRARLGATLEKHHLRQRQEQARLRMEEELNVGRDIQMSMLPLTFPPFPERTDFSVFATLEPAREVGGDFYDLFLIDEHRFCFSVGDVSGKGVPAALFMAVTKTLLKARSAFDPSPGSVFTHVNDELSENNDASMFVTLWLAILDTRTGEVVYCNAGHNPPYLRRADGSLLRLGALHGPVIGAMSGIPYGEDRVRMAPGDTLFLYTDGVTEAMDPMGALYGEERMCEVLEAGVSPSAESIVDASASDVWRFQAEAEQADDVTIMAVQYHPEDLGTP